MPIRIRKITPHIEMPNSLIICRVAMPLCSVRRDRRGAIAAALRQQAVEYFGQSCTADGPGFQNLGHSHTQPSMSRSFTHSPFSVSGIHARGTAFRNEVDPRQGCAVTAGFGRGPSPWSVLDGSGAMDRVLWGRRHPPEGHCEGSRPRDAREEEHLSRSGEPSYLPAPAAGGFRDGRAPAGRGPMPIEQPPSHLCGGWPAIPSNQRHQRSVTGFWKIRTHSVPAKTVG